MQKEIKFRGYDVDLNKWHYGNYYFYTDRILCIATEEQHKENEHHCILFDGFCDWNLPRPHYKVIVDGKSIGQYTGLKDKNGKEIYEGDILIGNLGKVAEVKWLQEHCSFVGYCKDDSKYYFLECGNDKFDNIVVIGNVYKNPELLDS